jgi:hypothetical protein
MKVFTLGRDRIFYFTPSWYGDSTNAVALSDVSFDIESRDLTYLRFQDQEGSSPPMLDDNDFVLDNGKWYWGAVGVGKFIGKTDAFVHPTPPGSEYPLSLAVIGNYPISYGGNAYTVEYPMGGSGFDNDGDDSGYLDPAGGSGDTFDFSTRNNNINALDYPTVLGYSTLLSGSLPPAGVDIVGRVQGEVDNWGTSQSSFFSGEIDQSTDIRTEMFENSIRLIRGIPSYCQGSLDKFGGVYDCSVVLIDKGCTADDIDYLGDCLVSLKDGDIPSGRTLVVVNGNVLITENLTTDNIGVITFQTPVKAFPEFGNIFVAPIVQKIYGYFFADGMFAGNDSGTNLLASNDGGTGDRQLYLRGGLISNNTLGGFEIQRSPWGDLTTSQ